MIIGTFDYDETTDTFRGEIDTLTFRGQIKLIAHEHDGKVSRNAKRNYPNYVVLLKKNEEKMIEVGGGWMMPPHPEYEQAISVRLDDPLAGKIWFRLRRKEPAWVATWYPARRGDKDEEGASESDEQDSAETNGLGTQRSRFRQHSSSSSPIADHSGEPAELPE